jgi:hypothetical protein
MKHSKQLKSTLLRSRLYPFFSRNGHNGSNTLGFDRRSAKLRWRAFVMACHNPFSPFSGLGFSGSQMALASGGKMSSK